MFLAEHSLASRPINFRNETETKVFVYSAAKSLPMSM